MTYRWVRKRTGETDRATYETVGLGQEIKLVIHDRGFNIHCGDGRYFSSSILGKTLRLDLDNLKKCLKEVGIKKLPEIPKKYITENQSRDFE